jgi:hypothetical protein
MTEDRMALIEAISKADDGWVPLSTVGKQLSNLASDFDPRTYGFRKLSELVRKTNQFEIEQPEGGPLRIRAKRTGKKWGGPPPWRIVPIRPRVGPQAALSMVPRARGSDRRG